MGTPSPNLYPDPSYALWRWAWETIPGVPPATGWHDEEFAGEKMGATFATLARNLITSSGEQPSPMDGKIGNGTFEGAKVDAFNPESDWFMLAAFFGAVASPVLLEAAGGPLPAAYMHRLSRSQTGFTFPSTFAGLVWRDDNMADRKAFGRMQQIVVNFAEKALVGFTPTLVFARNDYLDDAIRTAGTGTALPVFRGGYPAQFGADDTQNLAVQGSAFTSTTFTCKVKLGDSDSYGSSSQVFTRGNWQNVLDESGFLIGLPGQPLQAYFPLTGTLSATDVFTVARHRLAWAPSFPTRMAVNEVLSTITVDGVDAEVKTGALTMAGPSEAVFGFGGRQARRSRTRGQRTYSGTIAREYLDASFVARLEKSQSFALTLFLDTGVPIGATGQLTEGVRLIAKNCKLAGAAPSVTDPKTLDESLTFTCHPSSDGTYPDSVTAEVINSIPDLSVA